MKKIFLFDLDGPLIDVREKYYRVYSDLMSEQGFHSIPQAQYWELKRQKVPEKTILSLSKAEGYFPTYTRLRVERIETLEYLAYDRLQPGAFNVLSAISKHLSPVLVTMRNNPANLKWELKHLEIFDLFAAVLCAGDLEPSQRPNHETKAELVYRHLSGQSAEIVAIIGDTETDVRAGKILECPSIAVQNGIRTRELLAAALPTLLIEGIHALNFAPTALVDSTESSLHFIQ